jgi:hypothetical protein
MKAKFGRDESLPGPVGGPDRANIALAFAAVATILTALAAMLAVGQSAPGFASGDAARGTDRAGVMEFLKEDARGDQPSAKVGAR